jgi:NAD-dependent DNA ligase
MKMDTSRFDNYDNRSFQRFSNPALIEKDLQILVGIISGIKSDNVISDTEYEEVISWINAHREYEDKQPYKEVIDIIRAALADNVLTHEESENIIWFCNQYINKTGYFNIITSGIQKLTGIIKGIAFDNEINHKELEYLDNWMEENDYLKNTYPYNELYNLVTNIIQDKMITEEEHYSLLSFCKALVGEENDNSNEAMLSSLKTGYYQIDPLIAVQEKTFCITGVSKKYKRRDIAEKIDLFGGYVVDNVSSKLDYLVVCDEKNNCWAFTCYGRKIEEAIKHRKQGRELIIVHEYDLYDTLESL